MPGPMRKGKRSRVSQSSSSDETPCPDSAAPPKRVRGRPRGNPKPLSAEERRARNAQYERERRIELAECYVNLATTMGFDENIPNGTLLQVVLQMLLLHRSKEDIGDLQSRNANLRDQIAECTARLAEGPPEPVASTSTGADAAVSAPIYHDEDILDAYTDDLNIAVSYVQEQIAAAGYEVLPKVEEATINLLNYNDAPSLSEESPALLQATASYVSEHEPYVAQVVAPSTSAAIGQTPAQAMTNFINYVPEYNADFNDLDLFAELASTEFNYAAPVAGPSMVQPSSYDQIMQSSGSSWATEDSHEGYGACPTEVSAEVDPCAAWPTPVILNPELYNRGGLNMPTYPDARIRTDFCFV